YEIPQNPENASNWSWTTVDQSPLHGLGIGDLNEDGRLDIVSDFVWFGQDVRGGWTRHSLPSPGSARRGHETMQIKVYDVDADGDVDLILPRAHHYGAYWLESSGGKNPSFKLHEILPGKLPSQLHGVAYADIDGDGDLDIFAGKSRYRHGDPGNDEPLDVFWIELVRSSGRVWWVKHQLATDLTMGIGPTIADVDADGDMDLVLRGHGIGGRYVIGARQTDVTLFIQNASVTATAGKNADRRGDERPFIKIREVTWGDPHPTKDLWRPYFTDTIHKKYAVGNWDIARLRTYVDMLKAFGFNSIQLYDAWQRYFDADWRVGSEDWSSCPKEWPKKADPRDWPEKMDAIADYACSIGLRTSLFIWGNTAFDHRSNTIPPRYSLEPDNSADMKILRLYWDKQAEHAPHFDHIVTHWADPGGCKGPACTIESAQKLHNEIVKRFKKKNPTIQSTFSLWMLNSSRFNKWRGYKDVHTILDAGILPDDVMLCLDGNGGRIKLGDAKAISKAGRKVGVWGWYLTDNEIHPSMHVRTNVLGRALEKLPPDAHNLIEWYSIDSNCHGLNMQNLYVAGKLMRNPEADARAALREFIAGAFGPANVARVEKVFRAIEGTRGYWGYKNISPANLPIARKAHKLALGITIPKGFKPAFPMVISPKELARELAAQTEAIVELYEFSIAVDKVKQMRKEGAGQDKIKAAIANLPKVGTPTEWLTNLEYVSYLRKLKELK
ncbi:MAG: FG-GAP-like repeat-containing protein, partial [Planctomycetota bacterium]|nr:FG-GAP-like repeat-containing protein [Planctomycetota bacterium]